jgi:hypothetical protein
VASRRRGYRSTPPAAPSTLRAGHRRRQEQLRGYRADRADLLLHPTSNCTASTCRLDVGFISSTNGGTSWSAATQVAGPMNLSWLPNISQGRMFGEARCGMGC